MLLFIVLLAGWCGDRALAQTAEATTGTFRFHEVLVIGDDESVPVEYLFTSPKHIRTDSDGRIYVAEHRGTQVRVFGPDGTFLGALGREGEGPGEFTEILTIAIDAAGRLVVYDRMTRRFTRFPPFAQIESRPLPDQDVLETVSTSEVFRFLYGLPDGRFVVLHQPGSGTFSLDEPRLHVLDEDFGQVGAFGPSSDWHFPDDAFGEELRRSPLALGGSHVAAGQSSLILAPRLYSGVLYRYAPNDDGRWVLHRIEGRAPGHPTHEVVHYELGDAFPSFVMSGGLGARYRSASHGVGQLSDGCIVHLSTAEEDGIRQLQLELFGPGGALTKVGPVEGFIHDETAFEDVEDAVGVSLLWVDHADRLYLVDGRPDFPVIRVVELEK